MAFTFCLKTFINGVHFTKGMFTKGEFQKIRKHMHAQEERREQLIRHSRDVIQLSKQLIYALHRDDSKKAGALLKTITAAKKQLDKHSGTRLDTDMDRVAFQEYVEAACYYGFLADGKLPTVRALGVLPEDYLAGLSDLTGELTRKAVMVAIEKKFDQVATIKELVERIYGEFLQLNLRNNELRKKSDAIKWNLKKLEDLLFDTSLKGSR